MNKKEIKMAKQHSIIQQNRRRTKFPKLDILVLP